ncbi:MAG: DinB family protein [Acidobacteria bacterium]|nr:DinB family protein [Acidobacteriota bacterium]
MRNPWFAATLLFLPVFAQAQEYGQGWLPEFNHASKQILALAEATPAGKFSWRPAPGIRSISEVYMHIVKGNFMLLTTATGTAPAVYAKLPQDFEKSVTDKPAVIQWLKDSQEAVRAAYPKANMTKQVDFFGRKTTAEAVFLRLLVHSHEHMGQSIAYARMTGVVPPWSK